MIFAVFDPSPLTVCINCSFFTFIAYSDRERSLKTEKRSSKSNIVRNLCADTFQPNKCTYSESEIAHGYYDESILKIGEHLTLVALNEYVLCTIYIHAAVVDAPTGHVTLGANMANGIEQKGIDTLQQCIKKCAAAGLGIPATVSVTLLIK